jgi:phosphatidylserine/phosphatidylglycerophosphate/cardiolipin synthase-like enzyme
VDFLLDGNEFFSRFYSEIQRVKNSSSDAYIHLAFWTASHTATLTDPSAGPRTTVESELKAVADAGHNVKVVLWDPGALAAWATPWVAAVRQSNQAFRDNLDGYASGRIQVRLETYGGASMSQHEKIAIFSADNTARAIIGGENLDDWYWDVPGHPGTYTNSGYGSTIHDTAVLIEGPATEQVEQEWNRRWRKVESNIPPEGPTPTQPQAAGANVLITVTDYENGERKDIQAQLLAAISSATNYVYLENYAIVDSAVVNALAERLRAVPSLKVIVNVPHTRPSGSVYDYLHYLTYVELAFASCTSVTLNSTAPSRTVTRASHSVWQVNQAHDVGHWSTMDDNAWLADSEIEWGNAVGSGVSTDQAPFSDIIGFTGGVELYAPVRATSGSSYDHVYIHSKLALIDDQIAIIGSANFNYRSLLYDGEISAVVTDPAKVSQIRTRLFSEWGMSDAATWQVRAQANRTTFAGGGAVPGQIYIVPLAMSDFTRTPPTGGSPPGSTPFGYFYGGTGASQFTDRTWY